MLTNKDRISANTTAYQMPFSSSHTGRSRIIATATTARSRRLFFNSPRGLK